MDHRVKPGGDAEQDDGVDFVAQRGEAGARDVRGDRAARDFGRAFESSGNASLLPTFSPQEERRRAHLAAAERGNYQRLAMAGSFEPVCRSFPLPTGIGAKLRRRSGPGSPLWRG
jgi:hypothetical protein